MGDSEDNKGFKMPGPSMHGGTQKHTDATNSKRAAGVKKQKANCGCPDKSECGCGNSPNNFLMKAAGMLIGANKRRQAGKDAAEAKKGEAYANMSNRKLS